jgi:predicted DNA-binding transcriptional regulator AlpA
VFLAMNYMNELIITSKSELEIIVQDAVRKILLEQIKEIPEQSDIILIAEVMEITGYARQSIYGLVNSNRIPHIKRQGFRKLHFSRKAIQSWLSNK